MKNLGQVTENQDIATKQDIPTNTNQLTNGAGFITNNSLTAALTNYLPLSGGTLTGDIKMKQVGSNPSNTFGSEFYFFNCYAGGTSPYGFGLYQWIDNFQFTTRNSASNAYIATAFEINGATGLTDFKIKPTVMGDGVALSSELPTKTSDLTNDSGFITSDDLPSSVTSVVGQTGAITAAQIKSGIQNSTGGFAIGENSGETLGGGAVGYSASTEKGGSIGYDATSVFGGAVGAHASANSGGAVGNYAEATTGGAIGSVAKAGSGFAGGAYSSASDDSVAIGNSAGASDTAVAIGYEAVARGDDAIQLGTGTNSLAGTLQFKNYQLVNVNGCVPLARNPLAQKTWDDLTSSISVIPLFGGTAAASGNITLSGTTPLMNYRMVFVLGANDQNNGAEWFMFYGWQLRKFYENTTFNSFKLCSSYDYGHWEITRASLNSTTLTGQTENMKIFEIWGVE